MKFRKKPVVIEAMRLAAYTQGLRGGDIYEWMFGHGVTYNTDFWMDQTDPGPAEMKIRTLEGVMTASIGDWIIRGVKGEFYPCKPDIFVATYEPVEEPAP